MAILKDLRRHNELKNMVLPKRKLLSFKSGTGEGGEHRYACFLSWRLKERDVPPSDASFPKSPASISPLALGGVVQMTDNHSASVTGSQDPPKDSPRRATYSLTSPQIKVEILNRLHAAHEPHGLEPRKARKKALLIGINYDGSASETLTPLEEAHNDVRKLKEFILSKLACSKCGSLLLSHIAPLVVGNYDYKEENIRTLLDDGVSKQPTRENIVCAGLSLKYTNRKSDLRAYRGVDPRNEGSCRGGAVWRSVSTPLYGHFFSSYVSTYLILSQFRVMGTRLCALPEKPSRKMACTKVF